MGKELYEVLRAASVQGHSHYSAGISGLSGRELPSLVYLSSKREPQTPPPPPPQKAAVSLRGLSGLGEEGAARRNLLCVVRQSQRSPSEDKGLG
jgi:hypothetical protein